MNLRDRIMKLFRGGIHDGRDVDVALLMSKLPGTLRASVSKECQHMIRLGLLTGTRVKDWNHGKKSFYTPLPLLLDGGNMPFDAATISRLLVRPMTVKDLRYAIRSSCGQTVTASQVKRMLASLGDIVTRAPGGSVKYPRYVIAASGEGGVTLGDVARAWAGLPGAWAGGVRKSNELRWRQQLQ